MAGAKMPRMKRLLITIAIAGLSYAAAVVHADQGKPPAPSAVDMDAWETQVLGGVFGPYCGYYEDRVTLVGRSVGVANYAQCRKLFDGIARACVARMKAAGRWHVASSEEGTALGRDIGSCVDDGFARFAAERSGKK
jgi:hypothetical protein